MPTLSILQHIRIQDVIDILFLSIVAYHLFIWFYETKAFKSLVGLMGLGIIYTIAQKWGLFLTTWVFQILWQVLVILLIILFQTEIRQVLERVNPLYAFGWRKKMASMPWIENFSQTIFKLANRRIGTLILFERSDRLEEHVTGGIPLEAEPTKEMLFSIFIKESPLHDGAAVIRNGRLTSVASFLPLTSQEGLRKEWGTRHRSAIGITERCDAWALVVSEERGDVSLARGGRLSPILTSENLAETLSALITPDESRTFTALGKMKHLIVNRWRLKLVVFAAVTVMWFSLAGQQDVEITFDVPVEFVHISAQMEMAQATNSLIRITARGLRKDTGLLNAKTVKVELDLAQAEAGQNVFFITRKQILLPNDRIDIIRIVPDNLSVELRSKPTE
jgi:diadenylate cyclase